MCESHNPRKIDRCMLQSISYLKDIGIKTKACCCGHGKYPLTIVIKKDGKFYELLRDIELKRKRKFYKKDAQGYYYIKETIWRKPKCRK